MLIKDWMSKTPVTAKATTSIMKAAKLMKENGYGRLPVIDDDGRVFDGRSDDYWGFSLGLDWWTRQHCSFGLAYSYQQRDGSREADAETQETTSYEYGRWIFRASWNY